ncbi:MAG TPA: hypothetical protein VM165_19410 [Planctomycetaceae bacterium]|nr:hypothetical protein [Planctomycetaceae bacterium]
MISAPRATTAWQIRHLTDLGWDASLAAESLVNAGTPVGEDHLVDFWTATRGLANHWLRAISEWTAAAKTGADRDPFESLAAEMLTGDMLLRLWSTVLSVQDRRSGQNNARAVLDLAAFNLQHVRHRLLNALLANPAEFAELDRLRRRCERWTDVLLGPLVIRYGHAQYAHDARRAWDFGEDAASSVTCEITAKMLRSSYRTAFDGPIATGRLSSEHWNTVIAGIDRQAAGCLGVRWPSRWQQPPTETQPTVSSLTTTPEHMIEFADVDESETAFVRSLRRAAERRRQP